MMSQEKTLDTICALLPQTQCGECGFSGCKPYAAALLSKKAPLDACPPGGTETLKALGRALNEDVSSLLPAMAIKARPPMLAKIIEKDCIGCTKCIKACPVDAIIGSAKHLHAIIPYDCTGCGLCVPACPVDCIELETLAAPLYDKKTATLHHDAKIRRLNHGKKPSINTPTTLPPKSDKSAYVLAAVARVQAKKNESS